MAEGKHNADYAESPTDTYRCDDYDRHTSPAVRPTGESGPDETVSHRSYDHDELAGSTVVSTVRDRAETKPVKASDPRVSTK